MGAVGPTYVCGNSYVLYYKFIWDCGNCTGWTFAKERRDFVCRTCLSPGNQAASFAVSEGAVMIGLFFTLFANTLDFWILRKYLQCFSHKRKLGHYQRVILFVSCVLLLSAANFYGNPNVNLLFSFAIMYLYSFSFSYSCLYPCLLFHL